MLNHTKKIKEIYENIQRKIYYMIPEKWEKLYLYSSILDEPDKEGKTGELFFYYYPKGIFKKKAINVYEIPSRFNLDENQYLKLVESLYLQIKELRKEFKKSEGKEIWSNLTMIIHNLKFRVEYDYTKLTYCDFNSYQRHIIWRYEYLGVGPEQLNKEEREVLKRYMLGAKTLSRKEHYDAGIYIQDIENMVAYSTDNYEDDTQDIENVVIEDKKKNRNQILLSQEEMEKIKFNKNKSGRNIKPPIHAVI